MQKHSKKESDFNISSVCDFVLTSRLSQNVNLEVMTKDGYIMSKRFGVLLREKRWVRSL